MLRHEKRTITEIVVSKMDHMKPDEMTLELSVSLAILEQLLKLNIQMKELLERQGLRATLPDTDSGGFGPRY